MKNYLAGSIAAGCCILVRLAAQSPAPPPPSVYTEAQAAAGRAAYEDTCALCHTSSLLGRTGAPGELPPVDSLVPGMQKVVNDNNGFVPPLAGPEFMARWGSRSTLDIARRIEGAVGGFPPKGRTDQTYLDITAYVLQANHVPAGTAPLTTKTVIDLQSLSNPHPAK